MLQAVLVGLWAGICGIDQFSILTHVHRPIVSGMVIGLIMGDPITGLKAGAAIELMFAGMAPLAGAQPPNVAMGGVIGVALTIMMKQDADVAVGLAVPFAVAAQAIVTFLFTAFSPVMHVMDKHAKNANPNGIDRLQLIQPLLLFVFYFLVSFIVVQIGAERSTALVEKIPEKVIDGLKIAGGIMPAVGFGMLLKVMFKTEYVPFFIVGFVAAAYLELPIMAIAAVGVAIAGYDYFISDKKVPAKQAVAAEEDYSDGI